MAKRIGDYLELNKDEVLTLYDAIYMHREDVSSDMCMDYFEDVMAHDEYEYAVTVMEDELYKMVYLIEYASDCPSSFSIFYHSDVIVNALTRYIEETTNDGVIPPVVEGMFKAIES